MKKKLPISFIFIPQYQVFNAALSYNHPRWRVDFKLNNLSEEKYWDL